MSKTIAAVLAPGESIAQFVIAQLIKGLVGHVTVDGKTYNGYVVKMEISPQSGSDHQGSDHLFATVHVPDLDQEEGAQNYFTIEVSIQTDGTVMVMPQADQPAQPEQGRDVNESCAIG